MEIGSLSSIIKKFSSFQENLVAFFINQVLKGLKYLHSQGVVHRDIKGANLLMTKDGTVKLADFGVAMKLTESAKSMSIVGTPYWMAPEIVEQTGHCATSCDIWSVGCTLIELLTGKPPYYDLAPMSALYRIVQDEYPPLPTNISPDLKDFLIKCFQKEPFFRKSAQELLDHPWLANVNNKSVEINEDINTQESDEEIPYGIIRSIRESFQLSEEKKSIANLSFLPQENSIIALRNLLNKGIGSDKSIKSDKSIYDIKNKSVSEVNMSIEDRISEIQDTTEIERLIENLDIQQSPRNLHRVLEVLSSQPLVKKIASSVMPIIKQILDDIEDVEILHLALQLTNCVCSDPSLQEIAGFIGLINSALKFTGEEFCKELRIEAAFLIGQFIQSDSLLLKIFLASGGIEAVVKLLDPNFNENKELVVLGIDCLMNLIEDSGNEYLRIWAMHGAIERLTLALDNLANENNNQGYTEKAADLLLAFSTVI